ncbi:GNAT family N-acetyltransferase [Dyadobacter sp. CY323]|uniref:GNAT family N-acetyltransferase n=1 Tax=Dyadobacter sp. CY323 TaxID=2907302 RepID=UPI001F244174|nr:GNAT family N-acetyltransferase [Dyadobacter sp. CY323]MCE6990027.1 GNAT family N-acetyltransferase [Dyadobacter sp. CY323]
MLHSEFLPADLDQLPALQPPTWGDLVPRFAYFIESEYCRPIKISENGQVVAIGTSIYHQDTVWLACIVVHPDHRNKGLGLTMTKSLIQDIDQERYQTIYLDATDFGYPVYLKLNFGVEMAYGHFSRKEPLSSSSSLSEKILPFSEEYKNQIFELDRQVSGEDRRGVLSDFIGSAYLYMEESRVLGYYIPDWGDGPVLAIDDVAGIELLRMHIQRAGTAILPIDNKSAIQFLEANGFQQLRFSRRMVLGKKRDWKADKIFNRISGQLG